MPIIHDNFRLQDSIKTIDEVCDIITEARDAYNGIPINRNRKAITGVPELRTARSLHTASQNYNNNAWTDQPKVYVQQKTNGMLGTKMAVITPSAASPRGMVWQTYIVDADSLGKLRYKFVNLGPKNGAIIENRLTTQRAYQPHPVGKWSARPYQPHPTASLDNLYTSTTLFTIRVNNGTGLTDYMKTPIPELHREWVTPEGSMALYVRLHNYTETPDGEIAYRNPMVALCYLRDMKAPKDVLWRKLSTWEKVIPGITFNLSRPEFPLDEQDRLFVMNEMSRLADQN